MLMPAQMIPKLSGWWQNYFVSTADTINVYMQAFSVTLAFPISYQESSGTPDNLGKIVPDVEIEVQVALAGLYMIVECCL